MVMAGTSFGMPDLMSAWRAGFWPLPAAQHLAQDDFGDLVGLDAALGEQRADDGGAEFGGGHLGERAAELADGGAQRADDDDVGHGMDSSVRREMPASMRAGCGGHVNAARAARAAMREVMLRRLRRAAA